MKHKKTMMLALLAAGGICWYLGTRITPQELQSLLQGLGSWAAIGYIGLFTVLPAFFFPVAVLALAGGLLFGLWYGSFYTFIGAILNCSLMFFLARYAGRKQVEALIRSKLSGQWQKRIETLNSSGGFLFLIILRLIPAVPYNLINYAFGLSSMSFGTYILASTIGIIPGTFAFINIGDKALDVTSPDFWIAIGLLVLLLVVTAALGKKLYPNNKTNGE
ncbi:MAG: TVP38/TMEM64 family protein [Oscillospiraceae bacterium]|nr:TVP38/TMEM64 family protein [Oscillospiraceae bacterium]